MSTSAVDRLRRFATRAIDHSTCDICRSNLADRHRHLLMMDQRRLMCACDSCALLLPHGDGGRIRLIPQSTTRIDIDLSDDKWTGLGVPIGIAFFTAIEESITASSVSAAPAVRVGYPSPSGLVTSSIAKDSWQNFVGANPKVSQLRPEVESLLVHRTAERQLAFIVPLDSCFELTAVIRQHWDGWSGGPEVNRQIDCFFDRLERASLDADAAGCVLDVASNGVS